MAIEEWKTVTFLSHSWLTAVVLTEWS